MTDGKLKLKLAEYESQDYTIYTESDLFVMDTRYAIREVPEVSNE